MGKIYTAPFLCTVTRPETTSFLVGLPLPRFLLFRCCPTSSPSSFATPGWLSFQKEEGGTSCGCPSGQVWGGGGGGAQDLVLYGLPASESVS